MALDTNGLIADIKTASVAPDWANFCTLLGAAFDSFILSGLVSTTVSGIVTPPSGSTYPAAGVGNGSIITTGLATLQTQIATIMLTPGALWENIGNPLATAINSDVTTATVSTTVTGVLQGKGTGVAGCINTASTLSQFKTDFANAFTDVSGETWDAFAQKVADIMTTYIIGAVVTTTDKGTVPPSSWVGVGTGSIS
jgi:hypothetical protein